MADVKGNIQAEFRSQSAREFHCLIESTIRQSGAWQRHRNDQIRIGLFFQRLGQSGGQRPRAGKVTVVLQSLDQYCGGKFVLEWCDDSIEKRKFVDAAAA